MSSSWGSVGFWLTEVMTFLVGSWWILHILYLQEPYHPISHQDIHSSWHQIPVVEMIQQEFTCRYPLQNLFQPETNSKIIFHPSIFGCNSFFCGHFLGPNELLFLPCPMKGGRSGLLRVADGPKFFLPFGRLSTRHPATQIRLEKNMKKKTKQQNGSNPRNKGGLLLNKICWAIVFFGIFWRGWGQEMVALSCGYIRKSSKWRWRGSKTELASGHWKSGEKLHV